MSRPSRREVLAGLAGSALMLRSGTAGAQQPGLAIAPPGATRPSLARGAGHLTRAQNIGGVSVANRGLVYSLKASVDGLRLHDFELTGCGYLLNYTEVGIDCTNARIERVRSRAARMFAGGTGLLSMRGDLTGLRVEDVECVGDGTPYVGEGKVFGIIQLKGKLPGDRANGFTLRRVRGGGLWIEGADYPNTDGISTERGHTGGRIEDCDLWDFSDAGIDLKGDGNTLDRIRVRNARESVKLWGHGAHGRIESVAPRFAHVLIAGDEARREAKRIAIGRLSAEGDPRKPLVRFERSVSHVTLDAVTAPPGQVMISVSKEARGSTLTLPDGRVLTG